MLSNALKKIRLFHNMKQNELSQSLNISNSYLSEIENGKKSPSIELLQNYAVIFDIHCLKQSVAILDVWQQNI